MGSLGLRVHHRSDRAGWARAGSAVAGTTGAAPGKLTPLPLIPVIWLGRNARLPAGSSWVVSARATGAEMHGELAGPRRAPVFGAPPDLAQPRARAVRRRARQPDRCVVVAVRVWGSSGSDEGPNPCVAAASSRVLVPRRRRLRVPLPLVVVT